MITPNPKTSGGARWNYLAAWGYALQEAGRQRGEGARLRRARSIKNVPVLDSGARGSTTTFVAARHRRRADRLGERGAPRRARNSAPDKFDIVVPSVSILAEPPVAVVDKVVDEARHAQGGGGLPGVPVHRPEAQEIGAKNFYPPDRCQTSLAKYARQFPKVHAVHDRRLFGGWAKAQKTHFADGGVFDQIYQPGT